MKVASRLPKASNLHQEQSTLPSNIITSGVLYILSGVIDIQSIDTTEQMFLLG
jgi:hypothetical protein